MSNAVPLLLTKVNAVVLLSPHFKSLERWLMRKPYLSSLQWHRSTCKALSCGTPDASLEGSAWLVGTA